MSRAGLSIAFGLVLVIVLGYATEQTSSVPESGDRVAMAGLGAAPVVEELTPDWKLPAGPWARHEPPRKERPRISAYAACVVDARQGMVLYDRRADDVRPIASIIKLLTALVFLESGGDLEREIEITPEDAKGAGKSILWKGHRFKARDVLYTALMSSDNRAARALARSTPFTPEQFVERMRERAAEIGCRTLRVVEPTGLSELNVASAVDVARLLSAALASPTIADICQTYRHEFRALNARKNYRIVSSNRLLLSRYRVLGGKTGYIVEAGWCLVAAIDTSDGPLVTVVLGARSNSSRFTETRRLTDWALKYRSRMQNGRRAS